MIISSLHFERRYEFGPSIVWDALVDADLVSGWLAEATIRPEVGGEYSLLWHDRDSTAPDNGWITRFEPFAHLEVTRDRDETLNFALVEVAGGNRGSSTLLSVDILSSFEPAFAARVTADWQSNLDQLADLLRGHPVDWRNWKRDRSGGWAAHFDEAESDPASNRPGWRRHPHG